MSLRVAPISREQHLAVIARRGSASFLQCPSWGAVKAEWRAESLGWFPDRPGPEPAGDPVGAALVLYRAVPRLRRSLAYLPEGPLLDWTDPDPDRWLAPLVAHLRRRGAFTVKMGPPVVVRRWRADTVKRAIAAAHGPTRLGDVPADVTEPIGAALAARLAALGWSRSPDTGEGFGDVQPRYVFQLPLAGRSLDDIRAGFNQLWRRNIKKAEQAGVEVVRGGYDDLPAFHALYRETAQRDRFTPRPLPYFQRMWQAMTAEDPDRLRLYLARHQGRPLAATTMVTVGRHSWYSYGASSGEGRELRPSNAVQWRMIQDAHALGADVYDLRGIGDRLDAGHHLLGLVQFKLGTGGEAVEYVGEWDLPLHRLWHAALQLYLRRHR